MNTAGLALLYPLMSVYLGFSFPPWEAINVSKVLVRVKLELATLFNHFCAFYMKQRQYWQFFSIRTNKPWNLAFVLCGFHLEINFSGWHPLKQTTAQWWRPTLGTNSVITVNQAFWLLVLRKYIHAKSLQIY